MASAAPTYFKGPGGFYYKYSDFYNDAENGLIPIRDSRVQRYEKNGESHIPKNMVEWSYGLRGNQNGNPHGMQATFSEVPSGLMNSGTIQYTAPLSSENHKYNYTDRLTKQTSRLSTIWNSQNRYKGLTSLQPYEGSLVWLGTKTFTGLTDFLFIAYDTHNKAYLVLKQDENTKTWKQYFILEDPKNPFYWGFQNPNILNFVFGELYTINGKQLMYAGFQYKAPTEFSKIKEFTSEELNKDFYRVFFDYSEDSEEGKTISMHNSNIRSAEPAKSNENSAGSNENNKRNKAGPARQRLVVPEEAGAAPFAGRFNAVEERLGFGQVVPRTGINPATLKNSQEKSRQNRIKMAKAAKKVAAQQRFTEALYEAESAAAAPPIRRFSPLEANRVAFGGLGTRKLVNPETIRNAQQKYGKYLNIVANIAERNAITKLKKNTYNRLAAQNRNRALLNESRRRATERRAGVASIAAAAEAAAAQQRAYNEARAQVNPNLNRMLESGHRGLLNRYTRNARALKAAAPAYGPIAAVLTPARTPVPVVSMNAVNGMTVNPMRAARPGSGAGGQQQMQRLIFGTRKNKNGNRAKLGPLSTRNNPLRKGK